MLPPALKVRDVLVGIFFYPDGLLLRARSRPQWRQALALCLAVCVLCAIFATMVTLPKIRRSVETWTGWFGEQAGTLWMADGQLHWERPAGAAEVPRRRGARVDFANGQSDLAALALADSDERGVWLSGEKIVYWERRGSKPESLLVCDLGDQLQRWLWEKTWQWKDGERVDGQELLAYSRTLTASLALSLPLWWHLPRILFPVALYVFLFTIMPVLLRRSTVTGGTPTVLCINLYASIPAVVVGTIYSLFGPPVLEFDLAYVLVFFAYLVWAFRRLRRQAPSEHSPV